ncbi:MAG: M15 family metallopeptidase [Flavobacteriales bacterium]|nr:M15 family metallopeptidase [Flavobacteriales bacterium]
MLKALFGLCVGVCSTPEGTLQTSHYFQNVMEIPDSLLKDPKFLTGRLNYEEVPFFQTLPESLSLQTRACLLAPVAEAFARMAEAARREGITLKVVSAARNFERQKKIWEDKWFGRRLVEGRNLGQEKIDPTEKARLIMRFSAMPGTSRHHWGTDVDINALDDHYFLEGPGRNEYAWLVAHAGRFGFCQVYSARSTGRIMGYEEEKWHWSYMPLATPILENYNKLITYQDLQGFAGSETAPSVKAIEDYVNGISAACKISK